MQLERSLKVEALKMVTMRSPWIMASILCIGMLALGVMDGIGIAQVGLDATPETHPGLAEPIGPLEYIGTELLSTGQVLLVIVGAILGAAEYRHHQLRTTFLDTTSRLSVLVTKWVVSLVFMVVISFIAAWLTFVGVQLGLGDVGLSPASLSTTTWRLIAGSVLGWTVLGLISQAVAMLCKTAIVPIVVLVPLGFGLGELLAGVWKPMRFFPTTVGNALYASPVHPSDVGISQAIIVLSIWLVIVLGATIVVLTRRDVGARG